MFDAIKTMTFTESFWSRDEEVPYVSCKEQANALRSQMVQTLQLVEVYVAPAIMHKLQQAEEVAQLWFLRIDIMQELSLGLSEEAARSTMDNITKLFVGHMPDSVFTLSQHAIRTQNALQAMHVDLL